MYVYNLSLEIIIIRFNGIYVVALILFNLNHTPVTNICGRPHSVWGGKYDYVNRIVYAIQRNLQRGFPFLPTHTPTIDFHWSWQVVGG